MSRSLLSHKLPQIDLVGPPLVSLLALTILNSRKGGLLLQPNAASFYLVAAFVK
jgi:hypothetical protein